MTVPAHAMKATTTLFLLFGLGEDRYALPAAQIVEVIPFLHLKKLPQAPLGVAGVFDYHGTPVPAIDLSQLAVGKPAARSLSTRIILVQYPGSRATSHILGVIAERATETLRRAPQEFVPSGVVHHGAPYLGPVASDPRGQIQWIDVAKLLPPSVQDVLFKEPAASS